MGSGLAAALGRLTRDQLADLLRSRPDLLVPPPRTLEALANRASHATSLRRALAQLDAGALQVLEGLLVSEPPRGHAELAALLPSVELDRPLERLGRLMLVWGSPSSLHVPGNLSQVITHPRGLGRSARGHYRSWYAAAELPAALAELSAPQRRLLTQLDEHGPVGHADASVRATVEELLDRSLLLPGHWGQVELPREVGLALRGARPLGPPERQPAVPGQQRDPADVDAAGAAECGELLRSAAALLHSWSRLPPPTLRSGGLGVRELTRTAKALGRTEAHTATLLETLLGAGLIDSDIARSRWLPTRQADIWLRRDAATRWSTLVAAWVDLPRSPELVATRDERDRPIPPLSPMVTSWNARDVRRALLDALCALPVGVAATPSELAALLDWRAPLLVGEDTPLAALLEQARILGLLGRGALTGPARALLAQGREAAAAAMAPTLPAPVEHVLLQADLTAVAPGPLAAELAEELALLADTESAGAGSVFRFSDASLQRGLDAGRSPQDVLDFLTRLSRTPVPQPLSYLVADAARRHGLLRSGTAGSYLTSEDPGLLSEVLATPALRGLGLRRLAPSVLVSAEGPVRLGEVLRAHGFSPREDGSGQKVSRPEQPRAAARQHWYGVERTASPDQLEAVLDRLVSPPDGMAPTLDLDVSALGPQLSAAAEDQRVLSVSFLDGRGQLQHERLQPLSVLDGTLVAVTEASGAPVSVPLRRVASVEED